MIKTQKINKTIDKNINELCYISATEALTLFKSKSLSPVELLEAQIARTETIESQINAFTYDRFAAARKLANLQRHSQCPPI